MIKLVIIIQIILSSFLFANLVHAESKLDAGIAALLDEDETVRAESAKALGDLEDKRAVVPLIAALKDKDSVVRKNAASSLGNLKDKRAISPLTAALRIESETWLTAPIMKNALSRLSILFSNSQPKLDTRITALQENQSFLEGTWCSPNKDGVLVWIKYKKTSSGTFDSHHQSGSRTTLQTKQVGNEIVGIFSDGDWSVTEVFKLINANTMDNTTEYSDDEEDDEVITTRYQRCTL